MSNDIGVDKLTFFLSSSEFRVSPEFEARVEMPVSSSTGAALDTRPIYTDTSGRTVTGRLVSLNAPDYQLTLKADRDGRGAICLVQFSAGAFSDSNLEPLGRDEAVEKTRLVQEDLAQRGLEADLSAARLSRLDVVRNVQMSEPVACYAPAMAAMGAKRRTRKMDFGGTGFILGNKQWEVSMYDKAEEMKQKGYALTPCPENTLRPELRFLKFRSSGLTVGSNVMDLRKSWDDLGTVYRARMKRDIFRAKLEAKQDVPFDLERLLRHVAQSGSKHLWQHFKSEALLQWLVSEWGLEAAKHRACVGLEFDPATESGKRQIRRVHDELTQAHFALQMQEQPKVGRQVKRLYSELRRRVLE